MGINHLRLSPELIASLYPESLVEEKSPESGKKPAKEVSPLPAPATGYPFVGKNHRSILFLVSYPDHDFIPDEKLAFLNKILAACKCSLDDIALINTKRHPVILEDLKTRFKPQIIFLWGALPAHIGMIQGFPDMEISIFDGIRI